MIQQHQNQKSHVKGKRLITDKLNRYIYEFEYSKKFNISDLSFDEVVEMFVSANEAERQKILESLDRKTRNKIEIMIEGGIL